MEVSQNKSDVKMKLRQTEIGKLQDSHLEYREIWRIRTGRLGSNLALSWYIAGTFELYLKGHHRTKTTIKVRTKRTNQRKNGRSLWKGN